MTTSNDDCHGGLIGVDFVGHATLMVHTPDVRCLFDPVLFESFHEGLFEIYPRRELDIDAMPVPDVVVLTHRHFDHFDICSLRAIPTRVQLIIPDDPLLHEVAERIGFKRITVVRDWDVLRFGETELIFTPSLLKVPEVGVLVRRQGVSFWNQVDTAIDVETAKRVASLVGSLSFLLAPWQPSFEAPLQYNKSTRFPLETYIRQLKRAAAVPAQAIAPGACGFRHAAAFSWQDQLTFPATRERFLYDYSLLPGTQGTAKLAVDPGDRVIVSADGASIRHDALDWVRPCGAWDPYDLRFAPVLPRYGHRPEARADAETRAAAALQQIRSLLQAFWGQPPGEVAVQRARAWQVVFMLEVLIDGERSVHAHIDFRNADRPALIDGFSPLANAHAHVHLPALEQLLEGRASWDRLVHSGDYRTHSSVFSLTGTEVRVPEPPAVFDPLWNLFPYEELERRALEAAFSMPLRPTVQMPG